jgi:hypothetical protein
LDIIQEFEIAVGFQRISDVQTVDGLVDTELPSANAHAFHTEDSGAMRLWLPHASVATLVPCVCWITDR